MQLTLPARGNTAGWSGHGLVERMMVRRSQVGTLEVLVGRVIPEPVLTGFVALDHRVPRRRVMGRRVLRRARRQENCTRIYAPNGLLPSS